MAINDETTEGKPAQRVYVVTVECGDCSDKRLSILCVLSDKLEAEAVAERLRRVFAAAKSADDDFDYFDLHDALDAIPWVFGEQYGMSLVWGDPTVGVHEMPVDRIWWKT